MIIIVVPKIFRAITSCNRENSKTAWSTKFTSYIWNRRSNYWISGCQWDSFSSWVWQSKCYCMSSRGWQVLWLLKKNNRWWCLLSFSFFPIPNPFRNLMIQFTKTQCTERVAYIFIADDAFLLGIHCMKPYSQKEWTDFKRSFNYDCFKKNAE